MFVRSNSKRLRFVIFVYLIMYSMFVSMADLQMLGKDENGGESPSVVVFCKDLGGPLIYQSKKSTNPLNESQI